MVRKSVYTGLIKLVFRVIKVCMRPRHLKNIDKDAQVYILVVASPVMLKHLGFEEERKEEEMCVDWGVAGNPFGRCSGVEKDDAHIGTKYLDLVMGFEVLQGEDWELVAGFYGPYKAEFEKAWDLYYSLWLGYGSVVLCEKHSPVQRKDKKKSLVLPVGCFSEVVQVMFWDSLEFGAGVFGRFRRSLLDTVWASKLGDSEWGSPLRFRQLCHFQTKLVRKTTLHMVHLMRPHICRPEERLHVP